jgi:glucose/arabinose dehydrogenase
MMFRRFWVVLLGLAGVLVGPGPSPAAAAPPAGFDRTLVADGLDTPTAFRFVPDGRIFIAQKNGSVRLVKNGVLQSTPMITVPTASTDERGLLGIEVDPAFVTNHFVYLAYTHAENLDRVSRFTVTGDTIDPGSERVLLRSGQPADVFHHGGELRFGPDGKLYWGSGINVYSPNAQDLNTIHGKILRLNSDGSIPPDNPFVGMPGMQPAIWAYGLRNPFRFDMIPNGPNAGKPIVADVGGALFEEIDVIERGANYGWPTAEGFCDGCGFAQPVYAYPHTPPPASSGSITAIAVYTGNAFPPEFTNAVFFADYTLGFVKYLTMDPTYTSVLAVHDFDLNAGTPVQLTVGPDGALYQLNIYPGQLLRIAPSGGNRTPVANGAASPDNGLAPLDVQFSSAGSFDPDGTAVTYRWDFQDGTTSNEPNPVHRYTANGRYPVTLTVSDGQRNAVTTVPVQVGNRRPAGTITSPVAESHYSAGDTIRYAGTATDPDSGTLPASAFSWSVVFHHAEHVHPFLGPIDGVTSGGFTIPRVSDNTATTWYEIRLTVTDSGGLTSTTSVNIRPNLVRLTVDSPTTDLRYTVDGIPYTGSHSEMAVVGVERTLGAVSPQYLGGTQYRYQGWSDGGAQTHVITTPNRDTTYSVSYAPVNPPPAPWASTDVGSRTVAGFTSLDGTVFTVGGGGDDVWDGIDEFHYVYQSLPGDGDIVARVLSQTGTNEWAKAGVMIKAGAGAGATYAMAAMTPGHGVRFQADFTSDSAGPSVTMPNAWVKLSRRGNTVTGFASSDGVAWTTIGVVNLALPATATIGLFATAHDNAQLSTARFDHVVVTTGSGPALPAPWAAGDVGSPALAGGATESAGTFTVTGAGADIWDTLDEFQFVHQPLTGDGTIVARVTSQQNTNEWAKAGLMVKAGVTAGSPYAFVSVTPAHGTRVQAGFHTDIGGSASGAPRWLKLTRSGSSVSGYESADATTWALVGSVSLSGLPATVQIGLFVTSHDAGALGTAVFDHVAVTPSAPGLPAGWSQDDIGSPALLGAGSLAGTTWTVAGAGADIWDQTDEFHYVYRTLPGDGEIVARVLSQSPTSDWAKAGVMIKQSPSAMSGYLAAFLSPGHGVHVQSNFHTDTDGGPGGVPVWLKVTRVGGTVTASRSLDGNTWTVITTGALSGAATIGLFVTAHNAGVVCTATFDQVRVTSAGPVPLVGPVRSG